MTDDLDAIATARLNECLEDWTYRQIGRVAQVAPSVVHRLAHGQQRWTGGDARKVLRLMNLDVQTSVNVGELPNAQDYPEPEDGDA